MTCKYTVFFFDFVVIELIAKIFHFVGQDCSIKDLTLNFFSLLQFYDWFTIQIIASCRDFVPNSTNKYIHLMRPRQYSMSRKHSSSRVWAIPWTWQYQRWDPGKNLFPSALGTLLVTLWRLVWNQFMQVKQLHGTFRIRPNTGRWLKRRSIYTRIKSCLIFVSFKGPLGKATKTVNSTNHIHATNLTRLKPPDTTTTYWFATMF